MKILISIATLLFLISCSKRPSPVVNKNNIEAGTSVNFKGKPLKLVSGSINVGDNFIDKAKNTDLGFTFDNRVTVVSIVPSVDTVVCEAQTHILGETRGVNKNIDLVTISRDLPMAQSRFAKEAKLQNIKYYSDYKTGSFGKETGLLIDQNYLLARGVLVLDESGIIKYMQIVSELTELPDMQKALDFANSLIK